MPFNLILDYSGCGESPADFRARIVGGGSSRRGWWPWQVAVKKYDRNGNHKIRMFGEVSYRIALLNTAISKSRLDLNVLDDIACKNKIYHIGYPVC